MKANKKKKTKTKAKAAKAKSKTKTSRTKSASRKSAAKSGATRTKKASKANTTAKPRASTGGAFKNAPFHSGGLATLEALDSGARRMIVKAITEAGGGIVDDAIEELRVGPLASDRSDAAKAIEIEEVIDNVWDMYVGSTILAEMDRVVGEIDDTTERESDLRAAFARFFLTRAAAKDIPMALIARVDRG